MYIQLILQLYETLSLHILYMYAIYNNTPLCIIQYIYRDKFILRRTIHPYLIHAYSSHDMNLISGVIQHGPIMVGDQINKIIQ